MKIEDLEKTKYYLSRVWIAAPAVEAERDLVEITRLVEAIDYDITRAKELAEDAHSDAGG